MKEWLEQLQNVQRRVRPSDQDISLGKKVHKDSKYTGEERRTYSGPERRGPPHMTTVKFTEDKQETVFQINEEERQRYAERLMKTADLINQRTAAEIRTQNVMTALTIVTTAAIGLAMYKGLTYETMRK